MAEPYYDPHALLYIRAEEVTRTNDPPVVPQILELRRAFDLASGYSVAQLNNLLDTLEARLEVWVDANPPAGA